MDPEDLYLLGIDPDDYDDEELGAPRRRFGRRRRRGGRRALARAVRKVVQSPVPGVPGAMAAQLPLGFTTIQFVNAGATTLTVTSTPQKPIKLQRLVVSAARTAGAVELVTISRFLVGSTNVLPSAQALTIDAFRADAVGTILDLPPASPGITITIDYTISAAPGVGQTVDIATTIIGPSLAG